MGSMVPTGTMFIGLIIAAIIGFGIGTFLGKKMLGKRYDEALSAGSDLVAKGDIKLDELNAWIKTKLK